MMLERIKNRLKRFPNYQWLERFMRSSVHRYQEKEIALLTFLVDPKRTAIDVGANAGVYTHVLLDLKAPVTAIEANPIMAANLKRLYGRKAQVVCAAASSSEGLVKLRIPKGVSGNLYGVATIEVQNTLNNAKIEEIEVPQITLDSLDTVSVGFIKIDVEGHEFDVLLGAKTILERDRPSILVESEERHKRGAVQSIRNLLSPLGYHGFMLDGGRLSPIENFDETRDQAIPIDQLDSLNAGTYEGRYINNFVFVA